MSESHKDAILAAKQMTETLQGLSERLENTRKWTWRSLIFVAIDILVSVGTAVAIFIAVNNSVTLGTLHTSNISFCQNGNTRIKAEGQLWDYFIQLVTPPASEPAAQRAKADKLISDLHRKVTETYSPRDCQALYKQH